MCANKEYTFKEDSTTVIIAIMICVETVVQVL